MFNGNNMKFVKQKKSTKKAIQTRKKCVFTRTTINIRNNKETILGKLILKLLISNAIKNVCNVMANDKRNFKFCNLQTVTTPGVEKNDSFFRIALHM